MNFPGMKEGVALLFSLGCTTSKDLSVNNDERESRASLLSCVVDLQKNIETNNN
jgi:hypothetical protein